MPQRTRMPSGNGFVRGAGGGGRVTESDPGLLKVLQALVEASTRGDPQSPLLWTSKSTRHLAEALAPQGTK